MTINGATYRDTYDDEDCLGLRVGKSDSTGSYAYVCDGAGRERGRGTPPYIL